MSLQKEEKITFPVGTVVLQYINDDERCVAVVVDEKMADRLEGNYRERFEMHRDSGEYHILLVLGHFKDYDDRWSGFAKGKAFQFPTYIAEEKRTATKADLSAHINLMLLHDVEKVSRGLSSGRLHTRMFSFSKKQEEVLNLVLLVEHYIEGGNKENVLDRLKYASLAVNSVLDELEIALPRS